MADTGNGEQPTGCAARAGVGCFTLFVGAISGSMVGVLISYLVAFFTRAPRCEGIPSCDWYVYAGYGAIIGSVSLFALAMWRLRRRGGRDQGTDQ